MSTAHLPRDRSAASKWQELYEKAILELDNRKMSERIAQARHAIHERIEEVLADSTIDETERRALHNALRALGNSLC